MQETLDESNCNVKKQEENALQRKEELRAKLRDDSDEEDVGQSAQREKAIDEIDKQLRLLEANQASFDAVSSQLRSLSSQARGNTNTVTNTVHTDFSNTKNYGGQQVGQLHNSGTTTFNFGAPPASGYSK